MSRQSTIRHLIQKGYSYTTIGKFLNISRQRVHQIYKKYKSPFDKNRKRIFLDDFIRLEVMKRDNFTCNKCHYVGKWHDGMMIVHHVDESGQTESPNNKLDNLITLCILCHSKLHGNKQKIKSYNNKKLGYKIALNKVNTKLIELS